jgi:hypothetical protein
MTAIRFSATATATAATSITVPFGGTPVVGDLVVIFLLNHSEIIVHQPGWASEFTATPNPWFELNNLRATDTGSLSGWYHTWNASDSGNSAVFTFVPAASLGIGDKGLPSADAVAVAVVFDGSNSTAVLEYNCYGVAQDLATSIRTTPMKLASNEVLHAVATRGSTAGFADTDAGSSLVQAVTLTHGLNLTLSVFARVSPPVGYSTTLVLADGAQSLMSAGVSLSDNQPQLYNGPFIEEAPMGMNALMARYRMNRYFTVLNNGGTFSAQRYQSTDQIAAATQVFVNNQPITPTDRTNLLNSGVGGDFQATS